MPARRRRRNCALRTSSSSAFGVPSRLQRRQSRPPWRTQALGAACFTARQKGIAHLREQLRMLMTIDKVGRAAEQILESRELRRQFGMDDFGVEPPQQARAQHLRQRQNMPPSSGRKCMVSGRNGAVSVTCRPMAQRGLPAAVSCSARDFVAADRRPDHHHRGGVETAAFDQVANGAVDAGADTVIVGAQPDPARRHASFIPRRSVRRRSSCRRWPARRASRSVRRRNRSGALSAPTGSCRYIRRRCRS